MTASFDRDFFDLINRSERIFWGGKHPPLGRLKHSEDIYDPSRDFRLPPAMHRQFDLVMLVERDLAGVKAWPLVVDEALRLLAPGGTLLLRYSESPLLTNFALKNQLMAWTQGGIVPVMERRYEGNITQASFRLTGAARKAPDLSSYSFGLIADGRRPEAVDRFIASVRALHGVEKIEYEILVCAPEAECARLAGEPGLRTVLQAKGFEQEGWITRKKNQLVQAATHENIVIAHDRYTLPPEFLSQMQAFGADFNVLTCAQRTPDGARFADWVTLSSDWSWSRSALLDYDDYCRHGYINGGIIIAKRETLLELPWNDLLFWQQAEDVELTRRMQQRGITPRLARHVVAETAHARADYMANFEILPRLDHVTPLTGTLGDRGVTLYPDFPLNTPVALGPQAWLRGVRPSSAWKPEHDALVWDGSGSGDLSLRLEKAVATPLDLVLGVPAAATPTVVANGKPLELWRDAKGQLRALIAPDALLPGNLLHLSFRSAVPVRLTSVLLTEQSDPVTLALDAPLSFAAGRPGCVSLRSGWSPPEDWGVWSDAPASELSLTLEHAPLEDLLLEFEASAFMGVGGGGRIVGVAVNDIPVGHACFAPSPHGIIVQATHAIRIPHWLIGRERTLRLTFHLKSAGSILTHGLGDDDRHLGIGLRSLLVRRA